VLAGSSQKYHDFYGLRDPTAFASRIIRAVAQLTDMPVIYRPKPSWKDAEPIEGAQFSQGTVPDIHAELKGAWCMITHGSNAAFEAMLDGIPAIVLGDAVSKSISSTSLDDVLRPKRAPEAQRLQLLWNLAYSQFTMGEMHDGLAWSIIRPQILR
jgi:hypothetical protein